MTRARHAALCLLVLASATLLPGCFPIAATGVAVGTAAALDRRTVSNQFDDQVLQVKATQRLKAALPGGDNAYAYVTAYNRRLLLTGLAPDEESRRRAESLALGMPGVREVFNEIQLHTGFLPSAARDTATTARARAALLSSEVDINAFKVTTEADVVYLIGVVTAEEGKRAADTVARLSGVKKVVTIFEPITEAELEKRRVHGPGTDAGKASAPTN